MIKTKRYVIPNYYAILSAEVRYDNNLRANVKLLYAEITALCNMNGECFATNKYFAKLYNKSKGAISGWISELVKYGYIKVEYTYKEGSKEIEHRYIKILKGGISENNNGLLKKTLRNNTTNTNTNITYSNNNGISKLLEEVKAFDTTEQHKKDFLEYYLETNSKGKTKYQMQKTWSTSRRLKTWIKNYNNWNKNKSKVDEQLNEYLKGKEYL
jgi:hypothetical protein